MHRYVARMRWGTHIGLAGRVMRHSIQGTTYCLFELSQHLDCLRVAQWAELCRDVDDGDSGDLVLWNERI